MSGNEEDASFQSADAGSSMTFPMPCSSLRKNGHVLVKSRPCKIVDISSSATGKHGYVKTHIVGIDIFTGKKFEDIFPSNHNVDVPAVSRSKYSLLGVTEDHLSLADASGIAKDDIKLPDGDLGLLILNAAKDKSKVFSVTIVSAMGEEHAIGLVGGSEDQEDSH